MDGERPYHTVYRARVMRRRRRLLALLAAVGVGAIVLVVTQRGAGGGRVVYDRAAVVAYADRWAMSGNPAYWRSPDHDCADFVSQCVAAGGLRPIDGPDGVWQSAGTATPSIGWVNCDAQYEVWSHATADHTAYVVGASGQMPAGWAAGDVVYLGNVVGGERVWQHVIICVGRRHGRWIYDSHTVAHRDKTLATWYPAHFSLIRYCHIADAVVYH